MTSGALVPMGHACMRVSVFGLGKVAKPCQAMWSVIVVTIEGVTDSRPHAHRSLTSNGGQWQCALHDDDGCGVLARIH